MILARQCWCFEQLWPIFTSSCELGGGANQGWNINGPYWGGQTNNSNQDFLSDLVSISSANVLKKLNERRSFQRGLATRNKNSSWCPLFPWPRYATRHCWGQGKGKGEVDTFSWYTLTPLIVAHIVRIAALHSLATLSLVGNIVISCIALHCST